jgi:1-acyl-sn-glycerol-3-phosphate acyltransferase
MATKIDGRTIIVSNHISTWDPVLVNYIFPVKRIYFMAASILFSYSRIFSWFLRVLGAFPVDRFSSDISALSKAVDVLEQNKILGMFPEGKRSLNGEVLPFKAGTVIAALNSGASIIPIYISGKYGLFRRMTAVVGEKINLRDYCSEAHPSPKVIEELSDMLRDKIVELADRVPKPPMRAVSSGKEINETQA